MLKSAALLGSVLCIGIVLGLGLATLGPSAPSTVASPPSPPVTVSTIDQQAEPPTVTSPPPATSDVLQTQLSQLTQQLDAAALARQQLQDELSLVKQTVQDLEQRLDELAEAESADDPPPPPVARSRPNDAETLIAAGFDPDEADYLANRWGQQQMELLYLRDQAIREGWIDTPRYEQAVGDLRRGRDSIREELGPEAYDRFLFATGRANRVILNSIIDSSPAQTTGLQPGDTVLSYDGSRIFSVNDLRTATTAGEPGIPVVIEIDRDGQRLELEISRGPIGVTLGNRRDEP
ncbi:hypothetical protein C2W62_13290 [Candidatus Entotheonella serta]|nr:hypothetical protein C2W62_13290 [Candidatus Entotheonella serta]